MKSHTQYLTFNTHKKREYINITADVETAVRDAAVREGMVLVSAMHITAGVFGFKEYPYFEVPPEARQVPKVNVGNK